MKTPKKLKLSKNHILLLSLSKVYWFVSCFLRDTHHLVNIFCLFLRILWYVFNLQLFPRYKQQRYQLGWCFLRARQCFMTNWNKIIWVHQDTSLGLASATFEIKLKHNNHSFPVGLEVKNLLQMEETWIRSLGGEDPPEEEMATHPSILAWEIPWTEEPGRLQSTGLPESDMS